MIETKVQEQIKSLVDKFLCWKLPKDFNPDAGIVFKASADEYCWPVGTNLLTATQATQMFEYLLAEMLTEYWTKLAAAEAERDVLVVELQEYNDSYRQRLSRELDSQREQYRIRQIIMRHPDYQEVLQVIETDGSTFIVASNKRATAPAPESGKQP